VRCGRCRSEQHRRPPNSRLGHSVRGGQAVLDRRLQRTLAQLAGYQAEEKILLLPRCTSEQLALKEKLFENSAVTPAIRANDTTDIWLVRGGRYIPLSKKEFGVLLELVEPAAR
jgi:hypothetical protein